MKITKRQYLEAVLQFDESRRIIDKYFAQLEHEFKEQLAVIPKELKRVVCIRNTFRGKQVKGITLGKSYDPMLNVLHDGFTIKNDLNRTKFYSLRSKSDTLWEYIYE